MAQQPSVTIVIPAYNEERFIGKCLESCINQSSAPDEIIVVNNKSTDDTASIVRRYQAETPYLDIRLLDQSAYQGLAPTRDLGFEHARCDVFGRIDADTIIPPDWVEKVRRYFQDPQIDAASGPIAIYDLPLRGFLFWVDSTLRYHLHNHVKSERFLLGCNMAIRATAWKGVRNLTQLDPEVRLHEDIDLALTLFKSNFEISYEPTMVAAISGRRVESSPRDFYRYATRYMRTTQLHGIKSPTAHTTIATLLLLYYPFRTMRFFYDADGQKFTLARLRDLLRRLAESTGAVAN
ncbi:glycosyltransferase family 2 protein [Mycobacterium sp. Aquia_216]|uniref:glycosyltransferase n=1 Tax=Mycobacterium sp. Aquia_216 TaxID=2991729 RepID=UPI00227A3379|nr:glycosyltransferase family 2 protein [Mycobacterium sp. Aquia_216]WAJ47353.1 glycosyltransferase family 2 protein [Mycobacterium sp. Aquia_216]